MWWNNLERYGDKVAVLEAQKTLTYRQLAAAADRLAAKLPGTPQLIHIRAANSAATVIAYLAALRHDHVPLLTGTDDPAEEHLINRYQPNLTLDANKSKFTTYRTPVAKLHPDLGQLASTSGSTGSPKLARLSKNSLNHNAQAIAASLDLTPSSVAITSLPLHYCYGMSVVASHFAVGASVAITPHSVTSPEFWQDVNVHQATHLPGVPHTYQVLTHHVEDLTSSSITQMTQAGGPMPPTLRTYWAQQATEHGLDLRVMYGQTEATARIASQQANQHHDLTTVGAPIADTHVSSHPDTGTLHVHGPGIMMGYAYEPADLQLGQSLTSLDTGDRGTVNPDGTITITGRQSRMAKILGKRIDLDQLEKDLTTDHTQYAVAANQTGDEPQLHIAYQQSAAAQTSAATCQQIAELYNLPVANIHLFPVDKIPTLASGKTNYRQIAAWQSKPSADTKADPKARIRRVYRQALGIAEVRDTDSFASLNGDSLSYVSASVGIEKVLCSLPPTWTQMTIAELAAKAPAAPTSWVQKLKQIPSRSLATIETSTLFRSVAIVLIIIGHTGRHDTQGAAHALLVLLGLNMFRFQLQDQTPTKSLTKALGLVIGASLPVYLLLFSFNDEYTWQLLTYTRMTLGNEFFDHDTGYWFVETLVWFTLAAAAIYAVKPLRHALQKCPWTLWMAIVGIGLACRFGQLGPEMSYNGGGRPLFTFWFVAAGIALAASRNMVQSALVCLLVAFGLHDYFDDEKLREALCFGYVLILAWLPRLRVPRALVPVIEVIASSTLFIYLVHWEIIRHFRQLDGSGPFGFDIVYTAIPLSLAAGIAYWWLWKLIARGLSELALSRRKRNALHLEVDTAADDEAPDELQISSTRQPAAKLPV